MWKYILSAIVGFAIASLIFWGNKPNVQTTTDSTYSKTSTQIDSTTNKKSSGEVSGAKEINLRPDGSYSFSGDALHFKFGSEEISTLKLRIQELEKELSTSKTINYRGSIYVLYDPFALKLQPSIIGASYLIINPIEIAAEYHLDFGKLYVGPILRW